MTREKLEEMLTWLEQRPVNLSDWSASEVFECLDEPLPETAELGFAFGMVLGYGIGKRGLA